MMQRLAAVVIGRNEAPSLGRCLASVAGRAAPIVYVDSGSEDGSVAIARAAPVDVVELDRSIPFGVARSRNAGVQRVLQLAPDSELVQFVDGDSEMVATWFERAVKILEARPTAAIAFGQLHERFPNASLFHRLYAIEWHPRLNDPDTCGGMAMVRLAAFQQAGGFNASLVGFEDAELCFRLRRAQWEIVRLDEDMAIHDAGAVGVTAWWRRALRTGYSYAQQAALHGHGPERYARRACRSNRFWGAILPLLILSTVFLNELVAGVLCAAYPAFALRVYRRLHRDGLPPADAALYATACMLSKLPQAVGQIRFHLRRLQASRSALAHP